MDKLASIFPQSRSRLALYVGATTLAIPAVYFTGKLIQKTYEFWRFCRCLRDVPGPKPHLIWGNIKEHPLSQKTDYILGVWFELNRKYKDYPFFRLWLGPTTCIVFIREPDAFRAILKSEEPKSLEMGAPYRVLLPWLGHGLLIASGPLWFRNRRLLTPAFHFDILKHYMDVYNDATDSLLERWESAAQNGESVELINDISRHTLNILLRCAFSSQDELQNDRLDDYVHNIKGMVKYILKRQMNPLLYPDFIYYRTKGGREFMKIVNHTHSVADEVIMNRKKALAEGAETRGRHLDFLDILLTARDEDGKGLTDVQIRNEVNTFLFAGHDTTASAISWLLYALGKHQDHQDKVRAEVQEVLGASRDVSWNNLGNLPYLTMCIKETMRCYSTVPFIARLLSKDLNICGKTFPKGTRISIPMVLLHHNPDIWGNDHMEFKPERFSPENLLKMDPFAYVPFSAGPRNCIGQNFAMNEIKVSAAKIVQKFKIHIAPGQEVIPKAEVVMRPKDDILINLSLIS